ncbi:hypothetical protein SAMD00023353_6200550 [Rosellinia necatrix]|uniref:Large ribosomal subunit protein mL50 n=1 Tax=Rosellinia necatrix TaxID=77044 RepID=A0A1W2TSG6_ROSNE|nr:hypothetical protein SAMD00023353_6200550 [Rosellinia necatrix]
MRRIPRLRRPSGLASTTTNATRLAACASNIAHYPQSSTSFSSSSQSSAYSPIPSRRPTAPSLHQPKSARFYSSDKQQTPPTTVAEQQPPTPTPVPEQQLQQLQPQGPGTEVQFASRVADEIIRADGEEGEGLPLYEPIVTSEGPYTAPSVRVEAARKEDVADPTYIPAVSGDGLKIVGGLATWWSQPDHWSAAGDFVSFRPRQKVTDPALIEASVRRAVIEAFALREAGREDDLVAVWPTTMSKADLQGLLAWNIRSAENGPAVSLGGNASVVAEGLQWKDDNHQSTPADGDEYITATEALTSEEASALSRTWDPSWKHISLADRRILFAVTKRVFQLTGQRPPDHQLPSITTVQALLYVLQRPPKPVTLTEELQKRHQGLLELPNVIVSAKRVTRGDKEKALGRFKLMQEEFNKRGLPEHGHGYVMKGREIVRLRGGV